MALLRRQCEKSRHYCLWGEHIPVYGQICTVHPVQVAHLLPESHKRCAPTTGMHYAVEQCPANWKTSILSVTAVFSSLHNIIHWFALLIPLAFRILCRTNEFFINMNFFKWMDEWIGGIDFNKTGSRVRAIYNPLKARTGRFSISSPALQMVSTRFNIFLW